MTEPIKKLYYSISEVSELTGLKQYVLRYWETEFDILMPSKNRSGNRIYTEEDINKILLIKKLLYEEKFTVDGAKVRLQELSRLPKSQEESHQAIISEIREELNEIMNELKN